MQTLKMRPQERKWISVEHSTHFTDIQKLHVFKGERKLINRRKMKINCSATRKMPALCMT